MAVLAPLTVLCDQQTDTQITERYLGNNRLYLNASDRYFNNHYKKTIIA